MACVLRLAGEETLSMRFFVLAIAAACAVSFGCGGSDTSPSGSTGTLRMMVKDSPFTDAKSLLVTFTEVNAHLATDTDGTWTKLPFAGTGITTTRTCDLKKLQTAQDVLGTGPLTTGHYTQVRLVVSTAVIYFDNPS